MAKKQDDTLAGTSLALSSSGSTQGAGPVSSAEPASSKITELDLSIWTLVFTIALQQAVRRAASARLRYPFQIDFSLTYDDGETVKFVGTRSSSGTVEVYSV